MLKKTSIYLDEELDLGLARRAAEEGITKAEYIRRTLSGAVQRPKRPKPKAVGFPHDGPRDLSSNVDKYLAETGFGQT
jgi:hypothetical protein